jgi:hypothetical protein
MRLGKPGRLRVVQDEARGTRAEKKLVTRERELAVARKHPCRDAGPADGDVGGASTHLQQSRAGGAAPWPLSREEI